MGDFPSGILIELKQSPHWPYASEKYGILNLDNKNYGAIDIR